MGNNNVKSEQCEDCFRRNVIANTWGKTNEESIIAMRDERNDFIIENTKLKAENKKLKEYHEEYKSRLNYVSNILEK